LKIDRQHIEWAIAHIRRNGETDILPDSFEVEHIVNEQHLIAEELSGIDITDYQPLPPVKVSTPKVSLGFRMTSQPDIVDNILFTAMVRSIATQVERARIPRSRKIACSYRIKPTADGNFFHQSYGYKDFVQKSLELAGHGSCSHVLKIDISDFYNQISHHRIENNLEAATIHRSLAEVVEQWLFAFASSHHSQGIPVGPSSSIVLAEAALIDVDNHMLSNGVKYVRYVDDFHIFCKSQRDCVEKLQLFTDYLHSAHRLSLNTSKSSISTADDFLGGELQTPEDNERSQLTKQIDAIVRNRFGPYEEPPEDITISREERLKALVEQLKNFLKKLSMMSHYHLGLQGLS